MARPRHQPAVDWSRYTGVVIRSCWDYHLHLERFESWTRRLEAGAVPVWRITAGRTTRPSRVHSWRSRPAALGAAGGPTVSARVDGCVLHGVLHLMELELPEPGLFLGHHPDAPERFAEAIAAALRQAVQE